MFDENVSVLCLYQTVQSGDVSPISTLERVMWCSFVSLLSNAGSRDILCRLFEGGHFRLR